MIRRNLNYNEILNFKWKYYPYNVTEKTTKYSIINFLNSLIIKTKEIDENYNVPICIDTIACDILIVDNKNNITYGMYNHIYKGNNITIKYNDKLYSLSKIPKKIKTLIFLDDIYYHESLISYWSESGFSSKMYLDGSYEKTKSIIINSIIKGGKNV